MLFIINPISGKGKKKKIAATLIEKGYNVVYTEYAGHAEELARATDEEIVVAVGGDGTVNEVARALTGTRKTLGIIPCGSGDGLARHLGLSHNIRKAIRTIENRKVRTIDSAEINGRKFFSVCGVGFDAVVSERFALSGRRGLWNYIRQGLTTWKNYRPETYDLEIDGKSSRREAMFITIGNSNQWGNGAKITPLADLCDGILEVTVVEKFSAFELPWLAGRLMTGSAHKSRRISCSKCKEITIIREQEGPAHADGDWFTAPERLEIRILPASLEVIVP